MISAPLTPDESERLAALNRYRILDSLPEMQFDDLTKIAAQICGTPIALISLVDPKRQWFKSHYGLDATETPRDLAFCAHAIHQHEVFEIPDSRLDERFHDNPLVTENPHVIFYAGTPLVTPDQHAIGTLCVISDRPKTLTSEQKEALEALGRQVVQLMELRIAAEKYELEKREAKAAQEGQARFLASMTHEIRTPMTGVIGMTDLLLESNLDEESKDLALLIQSSGKHLLSIVNDILDYSKAESGHLELEKIPLDLNAVALEVTRILAVNAQNKGIQLRYEALESSTWVLGDPVRMRQVLFNLLGNAIKFTHQGEVCLKMAWKAERLRVAVCDTGVGIPAEAMGRLFQAFGQVDPSITRSYGGTGLGLVICQQIVKQMGGEIQVHSTLGQGSVFEFEIELDKISAPVQKSSGEEILVLHELKVLVAEDNPVNLKFLDKVLQKLSCQPVLCQDGLEAQKALENEDFDLVFLDHHMPGCDGIELARWIQERPGVKPYLAMLTGETSQDEEALCSSCGIQSLLLKPVTRAGLGAVLQKVQSLKAGA